MEKIEAFSKIEEKIEAISKIEEKNQSTFDSCFCSNSNNLRSGKLTSEKKKEVKYHKTD